MNPDDLFPEEDGEIADFEVDDVARVTFERMTESVVEVVITKNDGRALSLSFFVEGDGVFKRIGVEPEFLEPEEVTVEVL
jgi:hypothetical protein